MNDALSPSQQAPRWPQRAGAGAGAHRPRRAGGRTGARARHRAGRGRARGRQRLQHLPALGRPVRGCWPKRPRTGSTRTGRCPTPAPLRKDLEAWARELIEHLAKPCNTSLLKAAAALATGDADTDCLRNRRKEALTLVEQARARGEHAPEAAAGDRPPDRADRVPAGVRGGAGEAALAGRLVVGAVCDCGARPLSRISV
jgi:hypothetical protein